jgi:hypothetical protein
MNDRDNQPEDAATAEKLRAALARLNARPVAVPPKVDDAILRAAREHLTEVAFATAQTTESASQLPSRKAATLSPSGGEGRVRGRRVSERFTLHGWLAEIHTGLLEFLANRRWASLGAVAVTIVAVGALVWLGGRLSSAARPEDLNGDGVVDMLDAFALARELQHNPASHPQLDLNRDGIVDDRDVQALAARAVSLESGGRS